jgi:uncharacterized membrane protein YdjX (TVP38/TMEM64 family)
VLVGELSPTLGDPGVRRVNDAAPNSFSGCRIYKLSGGCLMPSRPAALVRCRSSATAMKYRKFHIAVMACRYPNWFPMAAFGRRVHNDLGDPMNHPTHNSTKDDFAATMQCD